jgi:hypothetical protein
MRAAFPGMAIEQAAYWDDLKKVGTTVVFERVMLVNRSAAHKQWAFHLFSIAPLLNMAIEARLGVSGTR